MEVQKDKIKERSERIEVIFGFIIEEVKNKLNFLLEKNIEIGNIDNNKIKERTFDKLSEKNIELSEYEKKEINHIIDILIKIILDLEKEKKLNNIEFNNNIGFEDIKKEILFLWDNGGLKDNKIMLLKILLLSFLSEGFKIGGVYSISYIGKGFNDLIVLLLSGIFYLGADLVKSLNGLSINNLSKKVRGELIEKISKLSKKSSDLGYGINLGFTGSTNLLKALLNNIIPNIIAILGASGSIFSLNSVLGSTAILGFVGMGLSSKGASKKYTNAHIETRKCSNNLILSNKNGKDISEILSNMSFYIWEKEKMAILSKLFRSFPVQTVTFVMILEALILGDEIKTMELMAASGLVASMRMPISSLIKTWYEDVIKSVSDTQLLTKLLTELLIEKNSMKNNLGKN